MSNGKLPASLPLRWARQDFLEVLLSEFSMTRHDGGVTLEVDIDPTTPTIWKRSARQEFRKSIESSVKDFAQRSAELQNKLDDLLLSGKENDRFVLKKNEGFSFRYCSGGTLPVVRMAGREYYCLFYREVHPVGWNIANGACDGIDELLNPENAIERELREELLVADREEKVRYVFPQDDGIPLDRPEFAVARKFWQSIFFPENFLDYPVRGIALKWLRGPDSLRVTMQPDGPGRPNVHTVKGCFLNVNALDLGIEVDRVAKLHLGKHCVLFDGEVHGDDLIDSPVGMFDVDQTNEALRTGKSSFRPDFFFYGGNRYDGERIDKYIEDFVGRMRILNSKTEMASFEETPHERRYALCPVTERIIRRYIPHHPPAPAPRKHDVFISFASEDERLARLIYDGIKDRTSNPPFFSEESITDSVFKRDIDQALESAGTLIVVASHPDHTLKDWVRYEWDAFQADLLNRKRAGQVVSVLHKDHRPTNLPFGLRSRISIEFDLDNLDTVIEKLLPYLQSRDHTD